MAKEDPLSKQTKPLTRRSSLAMLAGAGAAAVFIPAWNETVEAADAITCVSTTPGVTEGPYWVDEKLFRSDIRTILPPGQPDPVFH